MYQESWKFTRREVGNAILAATGGAGLAVAAGVAGRRWNLVADVARVVAGVTAEGNFLQRKVRFDRLSAETMLNPSEDSREGLKAWLGANMLEVYCQSRGWEMTAATIRHFLYGGGRPFDIGRLFEESLLDLEEIKTPEQYFGDKFAERMARLSADPAMENWSEKERGQRETFLRTFRRACGRLPLPFSFGFAAASETADQIYSLHDYYLKIEGNILQLDGDIARIGVEGAVLTDRYDWGAAVVHEGSVKNILFPLLLKIGIKSETGFLRRVLGEKTYDEISEAPLSYSTEDMKRLLKMGWAEEYDIRSMYKMKTEIDVRFPRPFTR